MAVGVLPGSENGDLFRKPLDKIPALGQAGAALEDDFAAHGASKDAQSLGRKVVFFDHRLAQPTTGEG